MASGTSAKLKSGFKSYVKGVGAGALKKGWDNARGATRKRREIEKAERIAAIPDAEALTDETQIADAKLRKGRASTKRVGTRQPLGGGNSLT